MVIIFSTFAFSPDSQTLASGSRDSEISHVEFRVRRNPKRKITDRFR